MYKKYILTLFSVSIVSACSTSSNKEPLPAIDVTSGDYECISLNTSKGEIVLALNKMKAPESVSNFLSYTNSGFYDGTIFHRVIDGFMVQGGGYTEEFVKKETNAPITDY